MNRKANGMTQKDLAEKLHVSDKTVSRWERDEGTPDLPLKRNIAVVLVIALAVTVAIHVGIFNLQTDVDLDNFMLWERLTMVSLVLYPVEILTAILVYWKRRKK